MGWKPASAEMSELLDAAVAPLSCQKKKMFGYPVYFLNGNMFTGIHQDNIILRLSDSDRTTILAAEGDAAPFEPMPGRPMKEYVVLLEPIRSDPEKLEGWLNRSYTYVSSLPPKEAKSKSKPRARPSR